MVKNITIFTTSTCASCGMVKKWLGAKGHAFDVVDLDEHPERQAEVVALSGVTAVPVTVIDKEDDSKAVVLGFDLAKLSAALA